MKKAALICALAAGLVASSPASATHSSSQGMILVGGGFQSFCADPQVAFPGSHLVYGMSEACFDIPPGANGLTLAYTPRHAQASLGCEKLDDKIRVYGTGLAGGIDYSKTPPAPVIYAPTVAQPFTINWLHGPTPNWSACGL